MQNQLSINYQPAFSHPIVKAFLFLLGILTVLDVFMFFTTLLRYDYYSPVIFHLAPALLVVILGLRITLEKVNNDHFDYKITLYGINLQSKRFTGLVTVDLGRFVTLNGLNDKGLACSTFITEKHDIAQLVFSGIKPQELLEL